MELWFWGLSRTGDVEPGEVVGWRRGEWAGFQVVELRRTGDQWGLGKGEGRGALVLGSEQDGLWGTGEGTGQDLRLWGLDRGEGSRTKQTRGSGADSGLGRS